MKKNKLIIVCLLVFCLLSCRWTPGNNTKEKEGAEHEEFGLSNDEICIKQDLMRGGAIYYISRATETRNLVNIHDEGRYIQQAYYAGRDLNRQKDGQSPMWSPWPWNPIQVGDYACNRAQILDYKKTGNSLYIKCVPMLWDMADCPAEAVMEQWTTLKGNVIKVRNKLVCQRTDSIYGEGVKRDQEIPAVYLISALKNLYSYFGSAPFTNASVRQTEVKQLILNDPEHFWGAYDDASECWMAFVDDSLWGVGVYTPSATRFLAGRYGNDLEGDALSSATSYIAPLRVERLKKNSVMDYEYYLIICSLDIIRKKVYEIRENKW